MHCQATRTSTAASTGPKRRMKRLRPIAPTSQITASASQSMTTGRPSPWVAADSLGKSGRATSSAVMPASNQRRKGSAGSRLGRRQASFGSFSVTWHGKSGSR